MKVFVDTAAVMEKPLAQQADIGWQGKHTNLVSREFGSWLFLGAIFTTLELPRDTKVDDHCGSCRACLDICPTAAFPAPYRLDARRCISYLTIEHKNAIPHEFRRAIGNRIYGCDDCLAVCPWNKFAETGRETKLAARDALRAPELSELAALDDAAFRALFSKSPIKRIGRDRFLRNVMIAVGNSDDAALVASAQARIDDASPLVRGAAAWALSQLLPDDEFAKLAMRARGERSESVRDEWRAWSRLRAEKAVASQKMSESYLSFDAQLPRNDESGSKLLHGRDQTRDVLRTRQAMIAVLNQSQHDIVLRQALRQFERMLPGHVRVLHALQNANRTPNFNGAAQHEVIAAVLDQRA